jgi:hypothetical protein
VYRYGRDKVVKVDGGSQEEGKELPACLASALLSNDGILQRAAPSRGILQNYHLIGSLDSPTF